MSSKKKTNSKKKKHSPYTSKPYIAAIQNSLLKQMVIQVEKELDNLSIPYGPIDSVTINDRYTSRYGTATRKISFDAATKEVVYVYHIEISSRFFESHVPVFGLHDTLLHEYLHTIPGCMNHGEAWQAYAGYVNEKLGTNITRTSDLEEAGLKKLAEEQAPYLIECENCHHISARSRICKLVLHPEQFRCKCGGKLKLIKGEIPEEYRQKEASKQKAREQEAITQKPAPYAIRCRKCGYQVTRERMSKVIRYPSHYRCPVCGDTFERIR